MQNTIENLTKAFVKTTVLLENDSTIAECFKKYCDTIKDIETNIQKSQTENSEKTDIEDISLKTTETPQIDKTNDKIEENTSDDKNDAQEQNVSVQDDIDTQFEDVPNEQENIEIKQEGISENEEEINQAENKPEMIIDEDSFGEEMTDPITADDEEIYDSINDMYSDLDSLNPVFEDGAIASLSHPKEQRHHRELTVSLIEKQEDKFHQKIKSKFIFNENDAIYKDPLIDKDGNTVVTNNIFEFEKNKHLKNESEKTLNKIGINNTLELCKTAHIRPYPKELTEAGYIGMPVMNYDFKKTRELENLERFYQYFERNKETDKTLIKFNEIYNDVDKIADTMDNYVIKYPVVATILKVLTDNDEDAFEMAEHYLGKDNAVKFRENFATLFEKTPFKDNDENSINSRYALSAKNWQRLFAYAVWRTKGFDNMGSDTDE